MDTNDEEKKNEEYHCDDSNGGKNAEPDCRNDAIIKAAFQLLKDLSYNGSDDNKKTNSNTHYTSMVVVYDTLCPIICDRKVYSQPIYMIEVSSILWRWSVSLAKYMVCNKSVWIAIQYMWTEIVSETSVGTNSHELVFRALSSTVGLMIASVPSEATTSDQITALSSLQADKCNQNDSIRMIQTQKWLVPMLLTGIRWHDRDSPRRCLRTLRYLIASTWGKSLVYQYAKHKDLTEALIPIIRHETKHTHDTSALACQVIEHMLCDGYAELQLGPYIETSLIETIIGPSYGTDANDLGLMNRSKLVLSSCQALTASLQYSPWNRSSGCFTEALFQEMLYVLHNNIDQSSYHISFVNLFLQLVAEEQRIGNVDDNSIVKTTRVKGICPRLASYTPVLEMLAILLSPSATKSDFEVPRSNAIRILSVLLDHDDESNSNRNYMAMDEHLLTALVNVCLINNGLTPLKDDAKRIIMALIPEL
jgi:hypothetical protein